MWVYFIPFNLRDTMQITLIPSDLHATLLISFLATDLQISPKLVGRTGPKFGNSERVRNGSQETLVGSALVFTGRCRK